MKGFTLGELVITLAIIVAVAFALYPFVVQLHARAERVDCANNLREIGRALYIYAKEHGGKFPESLKALYDQKYIADPGLMDCPASKHKGTPDDPDYVYVPALTVNDPSGKILSEDKEGNHPAGKNILTAGGMIIWQEVMSRGDQS